MGKRKEGDEQEEREEKSPNLREWKRQIGKKETNRKQYKRKGETTRNRR